MDTKNALETTEKALPPALRNAVELWANHTTDAASQRRADLVRDKTRALLGDGLHGRTGKPIAKGFFTYTGKSPSLVTALDVQAWQGYLESMGLSPASVYARVSRVSSWYDWALSEPTLAAEIGRNPVNLARPKAPKAYAGSKALTPDELHALLREVKAKADAGKVAAKRDYALLLFYLATGMRRSEVLRLRWRDVRLNGIVTLTYRLKGGETRSREVGDGRVRGALLDYLRTAGRLDVMTPDAPLWTSHDRAGNYTGKALTGHGLTKNLKRYAKWAGIDEFHLHMLRHSVASMLGTDEDAREMLDHRNLATTRIYRRQVTVKRDKHSTSILDKVGC